MLEIDHVFCMVEPAGDWAARLTDRGFRIEDGIEHAGQGTRNHRLRFPEHYLELLWLSSREAAEDSPLRFDRRADWRTTGACPFGIGLRGQLIDRDGFWPYHPPYAPDSTIWFQRLEDAQPFVFVFEAGPEQIARLRARVAAIPDLLNPGGIREIRLQLPVAASAVLERVIPRIVSRPGTPRMELVVGGAPLEITPELALV